MAAPVPRLLQPLMLTLARATDGQLARKVEYLREENRILRARVSGPVRLEPAERQRLIKYGLPLGSELKRLITVVRYETFRRWVNRPRTGRPRARVGRPRTPEEIRALVVRIARETGWGVNRILGELKKLGIESLSRTTVRNILREHGLGTGPERGASTWDQWIRAHAETLWACDFFAKRVVTLRGIRTCYALVFLHVKTRRVVVTPATVNPSQAWSASQARSFLQQAGKLGLPSPTVVLRDGDGKFGPGFNAVLRGAGCRPKRLPPKSPNLNGFVERWVKSVKVECLDRFVILGTDHFDHLVAEYVEHYHAERPHQGIGNELIGARAQPPPSDEPVVCETRLGGVLKSYHRRAA